ncbi:conserved hypothetical protein [Paraburkholderia caribensis]|uniref:hypothetical protein n=1 Tax=Paraburkholderia caribensis TaxID=75105 RepID=UPI001CACD820|nr:hypothetical protein [Paraburkholderia caribensis]CAG9195952.1 conserved hypothetical protein [Paraburkholderia caribensis]
MSNKRINAKAQSLVREGVALYCGNEYPPPTHQLDSGSVHSLNHQQIVQGVIAMLLQCNITSGSAADIDLYKLNSLYIRDPEIRRVINGFLNDQRL